MKRTLFDTWQKAKELLVSCQIAESDINAKYLLEDCCNIHYRELYLNPNRVLTEEEYESYWAAIQHRSRGIPLQYITKKQEFMGLVFCVNESVLIPRQDTECLVEYVLKEAEQKSVLDLCTGSGCIIISLAKYATLKKAVGSDISLEALKVAQHNREMQKVEVTLLESDLFSNINETFDIIVSNPPYIASDKIKNLMTEVKDYEPILALDGREDGLYFYKEIMKQARDYLNPNGSIFFEIGYDQGRAVHMLLEQYGFQEIKIKKDLAGFDRIVCGKR